MPLSRQGTQSIICNSWCTESKNNPALKLVWCRDDRFSAPAQHRWATVSVFHDWDACFLLPGFNINKNAATAQHPLQHGIPKTYLFAYLQRKTRIVAKKRIGEPNITFPWEKKTKQSSQSAKCWWEKDGFITVDCRRRWTCSSSEVFIFTLADFYILLFVLRGNTLVFL